MEARGSTVCEVTDVASRNTDEVGAAELLAGLCLATDLGRGFPLEHGLHSTLVATRLCERLSVDEQVAVETYYGCLLFYVGSPPTPRSPPTCSRTACSVATSIR